MPTPRGQNRLGRDVRSSMHLWLFCSGGCGVVSKKRFVSHTLQAFLYKCRTLHTRDSVQAMGLLLSNLWGDRQMPQ